MEPVHIVVQHVRRESRERFRLVAYRGVEGFWPAEFTSLDDLVRALRTAMPAFDRTQIAVASASEGESSIVWAGDVRLSDAELTSIGLRKIQPREQASYNEMLAPGSTLNLEASAACRQSTLSDYLSAFHSLFT